MSTLTNEELNEIKGEANPSPNQEAEPETITYKGNFNGDLTGTATYAKALLEPYRLTLQGDVSGYCDIGTSNTVLNVTVTHAAKADASDYTAKSEYASHAALADHSNTADLAYYCIRSKEADHATEADHALNSDEAKHAANADEATHALNADNATNDQNGLNIDETYAKKAEYVSKEEYFNHATVQGKATGTGELDGRDLVITIDEIATALSNAFVFTELPAENPDTTKLYYTAGKYYLFDGNRKKWVNIFDDAGYDIRKYLYYSELPSHADITKAYIQPRSFNTYDRASGDWVNILHDFSCITVGTKDTAVNNGEGVLYPTEDDNLITEELSAEAIRLIN